MRNLFLFFSLFLVSYSLLDSLFTLKSPYFIGSGLWDANGKTIIMDSGVRLTKNIKNGSSRVWNKRPFTHSIWTITTTLQITGKGNGGDGFAMWITDKIISNEGKAFGGPLLWNGLMIAIDTYDNNKNGDNPIIYGVLNNGKVSFTPDNDGLGLYSASCKAQIRNLKNPFSLKVSYNSSKQLVVSTIINNKESPCFVMNAELPEKKYLGYSASSFYSNDDIHDLISVVMDYTETKKPKAAEPAKNKNAKAANDKAASKNTASKAAEPAKATQQKKAAEAKPTETTEKKSNEKAKTTDKNVAVLELAVDKLKSEVVKSFESIIKSNEEFSKVIIQLAANPPRDYKKELAELGNVLKQLRQIITTIPAGKNTEELKEIKKNLDEVQTHLEDVTNVVTILSSRLRASRSDAVYAIQKRSASGHWIFFIIFEVIFALGIIFWKQMRAEKAKVI